MTKKRKYNFDTISGNTLKDYYNAKDNPLNPGDFPYTRGIHSNMYRGKLWTMRQFSGFSVIFILFFKINQFQFFGSN